MTLLDILQPQVPEVRNARSTRAFKTTEEARRVRREDYRKHAESRRAKERERYWRNKA